MRDNVKHPEDAEGCEQHPCGERYARGTLRRVNLDDLRQKRKRRKNADTVHQVVKKTFPRASRRERFQTFRGERSRTQMVETEHINQLFSSAASTSAPRRPADRKST